MGVKIIDCFIFYNELDLLYYRLSTLYDIVDYFIIIESTHTFSGKEKKLFLNENTILFDKFKSKMIHLISKPLFIYPEINYTNKEQWKNEEHQRNCIMYGLSILNLNNNISNDDVIIISDIDEIPDRNILEKISSNDFKISEIFSLEMDMYYYNLNTYLGKWYYAKILSYNILKNSQLLINDIRNINTSRSLIFAGWHLSYFADIATIQNKILNFSHQEFNNDTYTNLDAITFRKNNQCDLFNRQEINITKISHNDNKYLPYKYNEFLIKYIEY